MPYKDSQKQKEYQARRYREKNLRPIMVAKNRRQRSSRRSVVDKYKLERGCCVCGYKKCTAALDAHHRSIKNKTVSRMVLDCANIQEILAELELCDIYCSNCHKELHWQEENLGKNNKAPSSSG